MNLFKLLEVINDNLMTVIKKDPTNLKITHYETTTVDVEALVEQLATEEDLDLMAIKSVEDLVNEAREEE